MLSFIFDSTIAQVVITAIVAAGCWFLWQKMKLKKLAEEQAKIASVCPAPIGDWEQLAISLKFLLKEFKADAESVNTKFGTDANTFSELLASIGDKAQKKAEPANAEVVSEAPKEPVVVPTATNKSKKLKL